MQKTSKVNKNVLLDYSFNWCKIDLLILVSHCYITKWMFPYNSEEEDPW